MWHVSEKFKKTVIYGRYILMPIRKTNPFAKIFQYFSPLFYCNWFGMKFFMECLIKTIYFVYNALISLVKKLKSLSSGSYHKYAGFLWSCTSTWKKATIAQPIWLIPTGIALGYAYHYLYWAWWLGWRLAFAIVRTRILACFFHTVRLIETTAIGKLFFFGALGLLAHSLGWVDLSPAHLEAVLTEIFHVKNYIPTVVPLEPVVCHEVIQATDPKVAMKSMSEILKELRLKDDLRTVYFENNWSPVGQVFIDQTTGRDVRLNGLPCSPITKAVRTMTFTTAPQPGKIFLAAAKFM